MVFSLCISIVTDNREKEREREERQTRCTSRASRTGVRCTPREKTPGEEKRAAAPRREEKEEEEEEEQKDEKEEEEMVGLRVSPVRVGAYIDHKRVHDIREYIIHGF